MENKMDKSDKIKLIRSSTMKCLLNNKVKNFQHDVLLQKPKTIYERNEDEGDLDLLDNFSIDKFPSEKPRDLFEPRFKTPIIARWDITYQCNFHCRHCYSECSGSGVRGISTLEAKKILDVLDKSKVQLVQILGGEPLIRSDIVEIILYALKKNFIFAINSNGSLFTEQLVKKFAKAGLKFVQISLHGFEKEHNYLTRDSQAFTKAIGAIEYLSHEGINVSVSCVISDLNYQIIFDFIDFLQKMGVDNIQLLTPLKEGRAKKDFNLSRKNFISLKEKLIIFKNTRKDLNLDLPGFDIDLADGIVNTFQNNHNYEFLFGCIGGVSGIRIDPQGNACICIGKVGHPIASLLSTPMDEVMRKMYLWRRKNVPRKCRDCVSYLMDCQGGCYLRFD